MLPVLELAGLSVSSYFVFLSVGWCVGGAVFYRAARREGMSVESALSIMVGCALGATLGATLMSALFVPWHELPARLAEGSAFIGRTVIGGIAGGIVGVEVCKKLIGHARSTGDAFALAIPPGHAIGRIGCLLQGCCYGTPTSLPWGVRYPSLSFAHASHVARGTVSSTAATSLPVHPAPLYASSAARAGQPVSSLPHFVRRVSFPRGVLPRGLGCPQRLPSKAGAGGAVAGDGGVWPAFARLGASGDDWGFRY